MTTVRSIPSGIRGFDCNFPLSFEQSASMVKHGYRFVLRYVPRVIQAVQDLTPGEVGRILDAGLAVMPVQHVEKEGWVPSPAKGKSYGARAALSAGLCGIALGTSVWLDLEGVYLGADPEIVIGYCNTWFDEVQGAGYLPGIYVGWRAILTPDQLYRRLKFTRYWSAYNLDTDLFPAVTGVCMKQGEAQPIDYPSGWSAKRAQIDTNIVTGDAKDRFPMVMAPDGWRVWSD
jgi:hypothetical protein